MIRLVVVGKIKNRAIADLCEDYARRISHYCPLEISEIKDSDPEREAERIADNLSKFRGRIYALGEEGKEKSSVEFAKMLESDLARGGSAFIIGGPYGLSEKAKSCADIVFSMSKMTFTHEFARAILLEQIYRAKNISANTGYHH